MNQRDNLSGLILANRYEIGELLGTGGFGSTYRARDLARFNAACAVKELLPARRNDENAKRLFEREARLLSQLSHKQIPTLHGYFAEEERYYLIQDFVHGETLKERLQRETRLDETEVVNLIIRVLDVLEYLHDRMPPVIHRDIKPANIILGVDGVAYLIDFGAVREVLSLEDSATAIGTPGYTPHEQAIGHARPSSDIYALGATALEAISGRKPIEWHDRSTESLSFAGRLDCSPQFERVLSGMLADVRKRFNTAAEVKAAIEKEYGVVLTVPRVHTSTMPTPVAPVTSIVQDVVAPPLSSIDQEVAHAAPPIEAAVSVSEDVAVDARKNSSLGRKIMLASTVALSVVLVALVGQMALNSRAQPDPPVVSPSTTTQPKSDSLVNKAAVPVDTDTNAVVTAPPTVSSPPAVTDTGTPARKNSAASSGANVPVKRADSSKTEKEPTSAAICALLNERLALGEALTSDDREKLRRCR